MRSWLLRLVSEIISVSCSHKTLILNLKVIKQRTWFKLDYAHHMTIIIDVNKAFHGYLGAHGSCADLIRGTFKQDQYISYMSSRTVYDGTRRKIVLGFDVGTTYSGISYRQANAFHHSLDSGGRSFTNIIVYWTLVRCQVLKGWPSTRLHLSYVPVSLPLCQPIRFPAQETISGASKIPTIIYYDKNGQVKAVGAEATKDGIYENAMDQGWVKAEWYAILLSQRNVQSPLIQVQVTPSIQVWKRTKNERKCAATPSQQNCRQRLRGLPPLSPRMRLELHSRDAP